MDVEDQAAATPLPLSPPQDESAVEHVPDAPQDLAPSKLLEDLPESHTLPPTSIDPQGIDQSRTQSETTVVLLENHKSHLENPPSETDFEASTALPPTPPSKQPELHEPPSTEDASWRASQSSASAGSTRPHQIDSRPSSPRSSNAGTSVHKRSMTISKGHSVSIVLITSALETIASSKEAKRSANLRESTQVALQKVRANQGGDNPREIFEPLRLACETRSEKLMIASLDCISKLISYSFFAEPDYPSHGLPSPPPSPNPIGPVGASQANLNPPSLVDLVTHTITACHSETTPETVSLQIVKALLSLVLSPTILVHHSSLLKAIRTVYNVFLLSADPVNQMVAQGGLTQMVHHVFTRCKVSVTIPSVASQEGLSSNRESFSMPTPETLAQPLANGHEEGHARLGEKEKFPSPSSDSPLPLEDVALNGSDHINGSSEEEPPPYQPNS